MLGLYGVRLKDRSVLKAGGETVQVMTGPLPVAVVVPSDPRLQAGDKMLVVLTEA